MPASQERRKKREANAKAKAEALQQNSADQAVAPKPVTAAAAAPAALVVAKSAEPANGDAKDAAKPATNYWQALEDIVCVLEKPGVKDNNVRVTFTFKNIDSRVQFAQALAEAKNVAEAPAKGEQQDVAGKGILVYENGRTAAKAFLAAAKDHLAGDDARQNCVDKLSLYVNNKLKSDTLYMYEGNMVTAVAAAASAASWVFGSQSTATAARALPTKLRAICLVAGCLARGDVIKDANSISANPDIISALIDTTVSYLGASTDSQLAGIFKEIIGLLNAPKSVAAAAASSAAAPVLNK